MGREEKWGCQLGVVSWGWLQSPFFIVCLNQGHFFSKSFFINFYDFFPIFFSKHYVERGGKCEEKLANSKLESAN